MKRNSELEEEFSEVETLRVLGVHSFCEFQVWCVFLAAASATGGGLVAAFLMQNDKEHAGELLQRCVMQRWPEGMEGKVNVEESQVTTYCDALLDLLRNGKHALAVFLCRRDCFMS